MWAECKGKCIASENIIMVWLFINAVIGTSWNWKNKIKLLFCNFVLHKKNQKQFQVLNNITKSLSIR